MVDKLEKTIKGYSEIAKDYAEKVKDLSPHEQSKRFLSYLKKGDLILDIGCGPGRDAKIFTNQGYCVVGIDPAEGMLTLAKKNALNAKFKKMQAENISFEDESFHGIWACASLLHLPKATLPKAISGAYRVLKKHGIFYASFIQGDFEGTKKSKAYPGQERFWAFYQPKELEQIITKEKFNLIHSELKEPEKPYQTNPWIHLFFQK
tara:strand:- start:1324 stop:1941 length:618 start_codon:yes stop_codon:yes gene_type:complete